MADGPAIQNPIKIKPHMPQLVNKEQVSKAPRHQYQLKSARPHIPANPKTSNPRANIAMTSRSKQISLSPVVSNGPISPQEACKRYTSMLTEFEMIEINNFPDIYFVGNRKRKLRADPHNHLNYGFDDKDHNYKLITGDHLAYRFEVLALLGQGAFGEVARCFDHKRKEPVAVKVIVNTEIMAEQGQIEAKILARLNRPPTCDHIVRAQDFFIFRSHLCITFEILGMNLYELSQSNRFQPIPHRLIRLYAVQLFSALEHIHKAGFVHCDLKPENVLIVPKSNACIKVIDFGSSCLIGRTKYSYIQSRFYRAPEVIFGLPYGPPIDIWSAALVIVEMLIGKPLFPGDEELEVIWMISEIFGKPPEHLIKQGNRKMEFFDSELRLKNYRSKKYIIPQEPNPEKRLLSIMKTKDKSLIDFIIKCLTWDQETRMTASQALAHPWIRTQEITINNSKKENEKSLPVLKNNPTPL